MIQLIGIEIVILISLTFIYGYIYSIMGNKHFDFKDKIDPYYFSFTTMTTVGYGDYSPKSTQSKLVVMTQHMFILITNLSLILKMLGYI